jgi:hypothetical protein
MVIWSLHIYRKILIAVRDMNFIFVSFWHDDLIIWLIDCCLKSNEQYFSCIHNEWLQFKYLSTVINSVELPYQCNISTNRKQLNKIISEKRVTDFSENHHLILTKFNKYLTANYMQVYNTVHYIKICII